MAVLICPKVYGNHNRLVSGSPQRSSHTALHSIRQQNAAGALSIHCGEAHAQPIRAVTKPSFSPGRRAAEGSVVSVALSSKLVNEVVDCLSLSLKRIVRGPLA